jgi:hypothetical protein
VRAEEVDLRTDERAVNVHGAGVTAETDGKYIRSRFVPKGKEQDFGALENPVQGLLVRDFLLGPSHRSIRPVGAHSYRLPLSRSVVK